MDHAVKQPRVAILQYRLLHYRLRLFEDLRQRLAERGIELVLVHGQPTPAEAMRQDTGELPWAVVVRNRSLNIGGRDILWQPLPPQARDAALCIVMQENRILSNYRLQLQRMLGSRRLVAFWGHGRNHQSSAPDGPRERWKAWWLRRVDWWFAYTSSTRDLVAGQGFSAERITVLDNAIDGSAFAHDLEACTPDELQALRRELGIAAGAHVAIYCGSLYADKRIGLLLAAADRLHARLAGFHLLVVGDGPLGSAVREAARTRPWLHALGVRQGAAKARCFRLAQVMLNPGLVGLHVVDAFVAGTPLVTQASAPHSPEYAYLEHGRNGWVLEDDSAESYAAAVERIFSEPGLLARLQARCAEAARRYTLENMVENFAAGIMACLRAEGLHAGAPPLLLHGKGTEQS